MLKRTLDVAFEDERGTITDIIEDHAYAVTFIHTEAGSVRGNHFHKQTAQWAYVISGRLFVTNGLEDVEVGPGELVFNPAGDPHAWRALEDTDTVVFALGPRAGRNYEKDTYRLETPLIAPPVWSASS